MTVTVCGVFQLPVVNVSVSELRLPSRVARPVMLTVTSAFGAESRTTVNVEEPPASVVRRLEPSVVPV